MLGKLPVLLIWIIVGQGPIALAVGAGCLDIFSLICHFSFLSPSLWETARYRLKYCLKGPLSPKQPTNHLLYHGTLRVCILLPFRIKVLQKNHALHCSCCLQKRIEIYAFLYSDFAKEGLLSTF